MQEWLTGRLLVATPSLMQDTFTRSVVLVLDHGEHGALGVVVNQPSPVDVDAVLPQWQPYVSTPGRLFTGGPVSQDSALCLARLPGDDIEPDGLRRIIGSVAIVDLDAKPAHLAGRVSGLRVFAGYAGWSAGQLEDEIDDEAWFVVDAEPADAFSEEPGELWRAVLRRQSGALAYVASFPADPELN
ncbi:MAG: YqgE/AlgH family protein [Actinomycetales bacterium]